MKQLASLFSKKRKINPEDVDIVSEARNWYSDRYETVIIQRNFLLMLILVSIAVILASVFIVGTMASSKTVQPFVIEIEKKTGITTIVNPLSQRNLTTNDALNSYFIYNYIRARETYDFTTYNYNFYDVVRLFSSSRINAEFNAMLNDDSKSPIKRYGNHIKTNIKIRSMIPIDNKTSDYKSYLVRFTITEEGGNNNQVYNKIAKIDFIYLQTEMAINDRYINPIGFQVIGYRVDDDNI